MQEMKTILAVGSIAIDTLETPNGNKDNVLGGSAAYFSLAASLFAPVKMVGVVGNDYPEEGWNLFKSRQINTENVQVVSGKTFRWGGRYNHNYSARETLFTELGVFESFSPIIQDKDCRSNWVFLGNIQPDLQLAVAQMAVSAEHIVADTMNLWIDLFPEKLKRVLGVSNIFLLNHEEALQLTGAKEIQEAAAYIRGRGPEIVIIKMGDMGAYLSFEDKSFTIPVFLVNKVIDPTGAGDSFAGGFVGYLAQTKKLDFVGAVLAGSAVASCCVEGFGLGSLANVTREDVNRRIAVIRDRMSVAEVI